MNLIKTGQGTSRIIRLFCFRKLQKSSWLILRSSKFTKNRVILLIGFRILNCRELQKTELFYWSVFHRWLFENCKKSSHSIGQFSNTEFSKITKNWVVLLIGFQVLNFRKLQKIEPFYWSVFEYWIFENWKKSSKFIDQFWILNYRKCKKSSCLFSKIAKNLDILLFDFQKNIKKLNSSGKTQEQGDRK